MSFLCWNSSCDRNEDLNWNQVCVMYILSRPDQCVKWMLYPSPNSAGFQFYFFCKEDGEAEPCIQLCLNHSFPWAFFPGCADGFFFDFLFLVTPDASVFLSAAGALIILPAVLFLFINKKLCCEERAGLPCLEQEGRRNHCKEKSRAGEGLGECHSITLSLMYRVFWRL